MRALLFEAIAEAYGNASIERRHFDFNIFEVELDFVTSTVSVAEVLSTNAETTLPLSQFKTALEA